MLILGNIMKLGILSFCDSYQKLHQNINNFLLRVQNRFKWERTKYDFWRIRKMRNQIKVHDSNSTVDHILKNRCSVSRYGDGEIDMIIHLITGGKEEAISGFQSYNPQLALRLKEILEEQEYDDSLHIVCVPYWYRGNNVRVYKAGTQRFCKRYICQNVNYILSIINKQRFYFDANISRFYLSYKNKKNCKTYIEKLREIWTDRDVCFVEGEYSRLGVGNDLFDGASSIKRILCPSVDAFSCYDLIISTILSNVNKSSLLIIALGHTATVLAYDLSKLGFQAIDLGHVDVEYEWMKMRANDKMPICNKYVNEVEGGAIHTDCNDIIYNNQIIARVQCG